MLNYNRPYKPVKKNVIKWYENRNNSEALVSNRGLLEITAISYLKHMTLELLSDTKHIYINNMNKCRLF